MIDEIGLRGGARNIRDSLSLASEAANRDTPRDLRNSVLSAWNPPSASCSVVTR